MLVGLARSEPHKEFVQNEERERAIDFAVKAPAKKRTAPSIPK